MVNICVGADPSICETAATVSAAVDYIGKIETDATPTVMVHGAS